VKSIKTGSSKNKNKRGGGRGAISDKLSWLEVSGYVNWNMKCLDWIGTLRKVEN